MYRRLINKNYLNGEHDKNTPLFIRYVKFFQRNVLKGGHYSKAVKSCSIGYTFSLYAGSVVTNPEWYQIIEQIENRKAILSMWRGRK